MAIAILLYHQIGQPPARETAFRSHCVAPRLPQAKDVDAPPGLPGDFHARADALICAASGRARFLASHSRTDTDRHAPSHPAGGRAAWRQQAPGQSHLEYPLNQRRYFRQGVAHQILDFLGRARLISHPLNAGAEALIFPPVEIQRLKSCQGLHRTGLERIV